MDRPETNPDRTRSMPKLAAAAVTLLVACAALGFADAQAPTRQIEFHDARGRVRIRLGVDDRGRASLRMLDAAGRASFSAVVPEDGGVSLRLDHAGKNLRMLLDGAQVRVTSSAVDEQGRMLKMEGRGIRLDGTTSSIELRDHRGEVAWSAP